MITQLPLFLTPQQEITGPRPGQILVVSCGLGVDSIAMLVGLWRRGIRPDIIMFAEVGGEKAETYAYLPIINRWLESIGFPTITVVRYIPKRFKHWPPYYSLEENCLTNGTLPSITFGFSSCSQKWKQAPQHSHLKDLERVRDTWARGEKVMKAIGYDCSARDTERRTYADKASEDDPNYEYWYPLQTWGWDRDECKRQIADAGLPVPPKSSCFFCLSMKPEEVQELPADKLRRIVLLEARAAHRLEKVEGLWRTATKKRPGSMTEFIILNNLLPAEEVDRIKQVPAELVQFQKDFAEGKTQQPLGQFLAENFPEMYATPKEIEQ